MHRTKLGFTLVELLVVITIIGMLIALLIPAVNMLRERGRVTSCLNNQHQLAVAVLNYESGKRRLPGLMNQIPGGMQYTWVEALFPNLERNDLWNEISSNSGVLSLSSTAAPTFRVAITICPDDQAVIDPTSLNAQALLSYAVNDQFFTDDRPTVSPLPPPPLDRNNNQVSHAVLSNLKTRPTFPNINGQLNPHGWTVTTSQTPMLGDSLTLNTTTNVYVGNFWTMSRNSVAASWSTLAFAWPSTPTPISPAPGTTSPGIMMSGHGSTMLKNTSGTGIPVPGTVVVITYFDGHGQAVTSDITFPLQ